MNRLLLVAASLALATACTSDHQVTQLCSHTEGGFDIEEVSVLQDASGYPGMHDAVIMEYDTSALAEDAAWRVKGIDIMPMIAASEFGFFVDGQQVTVEVFDANNPDGERWAVTQTFRKVEHDWEDVILTNPTIAYDPEQKFTWWTFDFSGVIPTSGMTSSEYLVGVVWDNSAQPALGYSNFNLECDKNWTDYADGLGWQHNQGQSGNLECSWPMMRVEAEVLQQQAFCEEDSIVVEE